jgi:glutaconate CoA-transferase, subunit B
MQIVSLHPGVTLEEVRASIAWEVRLAAAITETPLPAAEELRIIRELDPEGLYK